MEIKFRLTSEQIATIQSAAQRRFEEADKAMRQARDEYNHSLNLSSRTDFTLQQLTDLLNKVGAATAGTATVTISAQTPKVDEHRPRNVTSRYKFPSRTTGGLGHEVVVGYDESSSKTRISCSCEAGRFQRECWAVKRVREEGVSAYYRPNSIASRYGSPVGERINFPHTNFGLPK